MKTERGPNFLTSSHLYQAAKQEAQKALGSIGIKLMAEVKAEPIKRGEQKVTPFQAVVRVLETAGIIYGAIDAGYMLWTKANTGHTDELTTRLFQTVYDEVQAGLNNNKVVIPGVDGKDLTVTMTPAAPTETKVPPPAPTETATPTPTEAPLPAGTITDFAEKLQGRYELHWKGGSLVLVDAATKQEVPQISFDKDGSWTRAYNLPDIEEKFTAKGTISDIKIDQDKLGIQDWELVEGAWQRKTAEFATETAGKTVELPLESLDEVQFEILNNSSQNPNDRIDSLDKANKLLDELFKREFHGNSYWKYGGMYEQSYGTRFWADNLIAVKDGAGQLKPVDTAEFAVVAIGKNGKYSLVGWIDASGIGQVRVVDKTGLNKPSNFSDWYLTHEP